MTKIPTYKELNQIDIKTVLSALGGNPAAGSKATHHTQTWLLNNVRLGITQGVHAQVWYDNSAKIGGAGAAKLVMHIKQCDYYVARDFLMDFSLHHFPSYPAVESHALPNQNENRLVEFDEPTWETARNYLHNRGLDFNLIDACHAKNQIGSDRYKNVVFRREHGGAFKRGTSGFFKGAIGSASCGCFVISSRLASAVAFVEAPIDALSLYQINDRLTVVATGGSAVSLKHAAHHFDGVSTVFAAFDNDDAGLAYTRKLLTLRPDALRLAPPANCIDWNAALQKKDFVIHNAFDF